MICDFARPFAPGLGDLLVDQTVIDNVTRRQRGCATNFGRAERRDAPIFPFFMRQEFQGVTGVPPSRKILDGLAVVELNHNIKDLARNRFETPSGPHFLYILRGEKSLLGA